MTEGDCTCTPPGGLYCNGLDPSFCAASACSGGCYYDESYRYAGACWCSAICAYGGGEPGYYQCCDCNCYGQLCACREFISTGYSEEVILAEGPTDAGPPLPPGGMSTAGLPAALGDDGSPRCHPASSRASRSATDRVSLTMFAIAVVVLAGLTGLLSAHAP